MAAPRSPSSDFEKFLFTLRHGKFLKRFREMYTCPKGEGDPGRVLPFAHHHQNVTRAWFGSVSKHPHGYTVLPRARQQCSTREWVRTWARPTSCYRIRYGQTAQLVRTGSWCRCGDGLLSATAGVTERGHACGPATKSPTLCFTIPANGTPLAMRGL